MRKLTQTKIHAKTINGNCFPTAIACILDLDDPNEVFQTQDFDESDSRLALGGLLKWLAKRGYIFYNIENHSMARKDEYYLVTGESPRDSSIWHVVIYQNGEMVWDPHPDRTGIVNEKHIEVIEKIDKK